MLYCVPYLPGHDCTKHDPKLTQTSLISKPRVVFHIRVIFELSIGNCRVLRTVFDN